MKATKAHKRISHAENLISDVLERYSKEAPDIREKLQDAKAAVGRAKDAVILQASSEKTTARKKAVTKEAAVKAPRAKTAKKRRPAKQDYEG
jgi:hypothetical protein